ncbi:MAG: hypothetical protein M0Q92_03240 [Methanoregula sp.]|jgi:hypothetical protein|nr:hypothetical protein [Methanoregula sp.]
MDIVIESVKKLETLLEHSGCSDSGVRLDVDPDTVNCRYERGACMIAEFGEKRGVFTTFDPIRACTKISFMFGAPLDTQQVRGAASAIVNVAAGFFCFARTLNPCAGSSHDACGKDLAAGLVGKQVFIVGTIHSLESLTGMCITTNPSAADVILIGGEGLIEQSAGDIIEQYTKKTRILCIGPSTAGIARLNELEHWCPYGMS